MKAIKILIFTIIGVLVTGAVAVGLIYFYTDTFKTNQEIFYKYFSEQDATELFDSTATSELLGKIATTKNEQNIKITANGNLGEDSFIDGQTIELKNKVDNSNKMLESQIIFGNSEDDNLFEIGVVRNNDVYGLIIKDVVNQYMALENNNLQQFSSNLGLGDVDIPNKIEVQTYEDKIATSQNDFTSFFKDLYNALKNGTNKNNYAKLGKSIIEINGNKTEVTGYELTLKAEAFKNILSQINQNQSEAMGTLGTVLTQILNTDDISSLNLGISTKIYIKDKKLVKVEINIKDESNTQCIGISKTSNNLIAEINNQEGMQFLADITRNGDTNSDKVIYQATFGILSTQDSMQLDLEVEASINFNSDFEITELNGENSVTLNNIEGEKIINLLQVVVQKVQSDTGFNDTILASIINLVSQITGSINTVDTTQVQTQEIQIFNSRFTAYEGEQNGTSIKALTSVIQTSNATGENQIQITYNGGTDEIDINSSKKYNVSFEYDDSGYVNIVNIDE